jgi:hypothetical protein
MTRTLMKTGLAVLALLFTVGCATAPAPKSYAVLMENPDGTTGQIAVSGARLAKTGSGETSARPSPPNPRCLSASCSITGRGERF